MGRPGKTLRCRDQLHGTPLNRHARNRCACWKHGNERPAVFEDLDRKRHRDLGARSRLDGAYDDVHLCVSEREVDRGSRVVRRLRLLEKLCVDLERDLHLTRRVVLSSQRRQRDEQK